LATGLITIVSGHLHKQQITQFLPKGEKRISSLPALADSPHTKTKESYANKLENSQI